MTYPMTFSSRIFNGTFKFSSVMMRLNWSLPRIYTTALIDYKYANTFSKPFDRYIGILF